MKKLLIVSMMLLAVGSIAIAQQGVEVSHWGGHFGHNNGNGGLGMGATDNGHYEHNSNYHMNGSNNAQNIVINNVDEAKAKAQEVLSNSYKGYKITNVEESISPRGHKAFVVYTIDGSGNNFIFHVSPWGRVVGPRLQP